MSPFAFELDFGLGKLPLEPGLILIRGPRQHGKSTWLEWLVAQEVSRRAALRGDPSPEHMNFWSAGNREINFVVDPNLLIEAQRGGSSPFEFAWFSKSFPKSRLCVVGREPFESDQIRGLTMEQLLLAKDW